MTPTRRVHDGFGSRTGKGLEYQVHNHSGRAIASRGGCLARAKDVDARTALAAFQRTHGRCGRVGQQASCCSEYPKHNEIKADARGLLDS